MVAIHKNTAPLDQRLLRWLSNKRIRSISALIFASSMLLTCYYAMYGREHTAPDEDGNIQSHVQTVTFSVPQDEDDYPKRGRKRPEYTCPYKRLSDLTPEERFPKQGDRHMISPPSGGTVTLVCCETTKGPWSITVRSKWAPRGAQRFLSMIAKGYFDAEVPLARCVEDFSCQFGPTTDPDVSETFATEMEDDAQWLPEGKKVVNKQGVKRFAGGYLTYDADKEDSRTNHLMVALSSSRFLGSKPWQVPWGELVGKHSFETLSKIYTGYGDNGPDLDRIQEKGITDKMESKFKLMDYIEFCEILDRESQD